MAVSLVSTGVQFPDSTIQTTAATASSGGGGTTASGNVTLTSASVGAQAITTTGWGQTVTLPSATTLSKAAVLYTISNTGPYPLRVANNAGTLLGFIYPGDSNSIGLADNSTAAGVWLTDGLDPMAVTANYWNRTAANLYGFCDTTTIDSTRTFILFYDTGFLYGAIFDSTTGTFGTTTVIFSGNVGNNGQGSLPCARSILSASNQIFCTWGATSGTYYGVVLSISGTTITVNTAASSALGNSPLTMSNLVVAGSTYVMATMWNSSSTGLHGFTISGTTVTIGTRVTVTGSANVYTQQMALYVPNSTKVLLFYTNSTDGVNYAQLAGVSGATITLNSSASVGYSTNGFRVAPMGSYWGMFYMNNVGRPAGAIFTVSGNTVSVSAVALSSVGLATQNTTLTDMDAMVLSATKAVVFSRLGSTTYNINILTNTSGTASAGTPLVINGSAQRGAQAALGFSGNFATFTYETDFYSVNKIVVDVSGASPTATDFGQAKFGTATRNGTVFAPSVVSCAHDPSVFLGSIAYSLTSQPTYPITTAAPLTGAAIYKSSSKINTSIMGSFVAPFDISTANKTISWVGFNGAVNFSSGILIQRIESAA